MYSEARVPGLVPRVLPGLDHHPLERGGQQVMMMMMIMIMIIMMMARAVCYHPDLEYSLVSSQGSLYIVASSILAQQDAGWYYIVPP